MAFTEIIETTPLGTDKGQILDENIRAFKSAVARNLEQISGYPDSTALVTQSWSTAGRPTSGLAAGLFGWNTDTNSWDKYNGSAWETIGGILAAWTVAGRPSAPFAGQFGYNTELSVVERYSGSAWVRVSGGRRGDVKMWSGAASDIETGWVLCDGVLRNHPEGGTYTPPDLRDRFIVGAGNGYAVGATGGEATHTLTIAEMPSHYHTQYHPLPNTSYYPSPGGDQGMGYETPTPTSTVGGDATHENRPPYYALCYLYKL
jgi:hypothetical protein